MEYENVTIKEEVMDNGPGPVDPMTFMTPEQAEEENKKADAFIKAFRFGSSEFFRKIKEVYEVEGIRGLKRLEASLDNYMNIRNLVLSEVLEFSSADEAKSANEEENTSSKDEADM